jgi:hypothetical protein
MQDVRQPLLSSTFLDTEFIGWDARANEYAKTRQRTGIRALAPASVALAGATPLPFPTQNKQSCRQLHPPAIARPHRAAPRIPYIYRPPLVVRHGLFYLHLDFDDSCATATTPAHYIPLHGSCYELKKLDTPTAEYAMARRRNGRFA